MEEPGPGDPDVVYDGMDQQAAYVAATSASCPSCATPWMLSEWATSLECPTCADEWRVQVRYREWQPARWIAWAPEVTPI